MSRKTINPSAVEYIPDSYRQADEEEEVEEPVDPIYAVSSLVLKPSADISLDTKSFGTVSSRELWSPFSDLKICYQEIPEFQTPESFILNKPILKSSHIQKFKIGTLLYLFYNQPGEETQALAASDLYRRGWKYFADSEAWYTSNEGKWSTFDTNRW
jgi:CCR4-NOT transcriptional regulation complex NOT5 subunit